MDSDEADYDVDSTDGEDPPLGIGELRIVLGIGELRAQFTELCGKSRKRQNLSPKKKQPAVADTQGDKSKKGSSSAEGNGDKDNDNAKKIKVQASAEKTNKRTVEDIDASNSRASAGVDWSFVDSCYHDRYVRARTNCPANFQRDACYASKIFSKDALLHFTLNKESDGNRLYDEDNEQYFLRFGLHDCSMYVSMKRNFGYWQYFMKNNAHLDKGSVL